MSEQSRIQKAIDYLMSLTKEKREFIINLLEEVQKIQISDLDYNFKKNKIKDILWQRHGAKTKLLIGATLGTLLGLLIFGTGGIGIALFGVAFGIWGFLAGTTGGVLISSLIQNFEKENFKKTNNMNADLNKVKLSDSEFLGLREELIQPDVYTASKFLREQ